RKERTKKISTNLCQTIHMTQKKKKKKTKNHKKKKTKKQQNITRVNISQKTTKHKKISLYYILYL
ncbi:hypothetical protein, partial [Staphylococcus aureus]|uniref:hypothetical protein n=1 Tax=Staphylococcus aureus TaxID=1280 RepID=UPI00193B4BE3